MSLRLIDNFPTQTTKHLSRYISRPKLYLHLFYKNLFDLSLQYKLCKSHFKSSVAKGNIVILIDNDKKKLKTYTS